MELSSRSISNSHASEQTSNSSLAVRNGDRKIALPEELWVEIFSYLPHENLKPVGVVARSCKLMVKQLIERDCIPLGEMDFSSVRAAIEYANAMKLDVVNLAKFRFSYEEFCD